MKLIVPGDNQDKALGKPSLTLPENNRDNLVGDNILFSRTVWENAENSRLEVPRDNGCGKL